MDVVVLEGSLTTQTGQSFQMVGPGGGVCDTQSLSFLTYMIESDSFNGKVHYTSRNGAKAIAYDGGDWNIQTASKR